MNSPVEKIKERLSIVDVISSYLSLEQSGKNYRAKCPFHNEKTPSFFVSAERGTYYCFGCGEKGDIFSFVQKFEGVDFLGSLKLLADKAGVPLTFNNQKNKNETERYYDIMEEATNYFEIKLNEYPIARSYLLGRGLTDESIKTFRIGFAPEKWKSVSEYLIDKGYNEKDLEVIGLIKYKNDSFYDRFRGRIMFPINDSSGRVIAFSGRILNSAITIQNTKNNQNEKIEQAKYLNSPETPLFNKSNVLFGIDKAKLDIRTRSYSIVVEGQMDLVLSHQSGFTNTVAVSGTALADNTGEDVSESKINSLGLIRRLSSNVIFAFDGDSAGIRAANRAGMIALSLDMQVKIAVLPEGKDPADIIKENPDNWKEIIKNSVNIISFHIDRICENSNNLRQRGKQIREIIFPLLKMIKSSIEKSSYISEIYSKTGISEKAIMEDFELYSKINNLNKTTIVSKEDKNKNESRRSQLERRLFSIIFWQNKNNDGILYIDNLVSSLKEVISEEEYTRILENYEPFSEVLSFESEIWYGNEINTLEKDLKEIILNLEEEILNEKITALLLEINQKERNKEKEKLNLLIMDYQKKVEQIESIKKSRFE